MSDFTVHMSMSDVVVSGHTGGTQASVYAESGSLMVLTLFLMDQNHQSFALSPCKLPSTSSEA